MPEAPVPEATTQGAAASSGMASPRRVGLYLLLGAAGLGGVLWATLSSRLEAQEKLREVTAAATVPSVSVVRPTEVGTRPLTLPGRLVAWAEAPVHARTSGFLQRRLVDIGDVVTAGQLLAVIDAPEVEQQLVAATAALATVRAQRDLSARTAQRWTELGARSVVSQQATDERRGDLAARSAQLNQAEAEVNRLRALTGFTQVVAPFDGTITSRGTDVGALINAGATSSVALFTVTDSRRLRLYVRVPQAYAAAIGPGVTARFTVPEHGDRSFTAELTRSADSVDVPSGSMLVQLTVDNAEDLLTPGAYAQVRLELPAVAGTAQVRIPASALIFRATGTSVAVVDDQGKVEVKPISIARDLGSELDISSGLERSEWVINGPSDAIRSGDMVRPNRPN
ncbi:efflux RND transporter periplasmic adaptor subunit [Roseococcus sp. SYP-B2431]|uniref:efflux RND transporter periplasmic adaptor subunit n=1 Tax=Roseococcus sp. SYP-B2431 TaxID=2496640 RepID=UPI00103F149D|nr:efflux RND transporter periplasmic adaptor subunit [Roseococcus sp. SYP-B2431]TCH97938.1 efflux RND transporter periplasmic adaptor subunit [Roseococcus sp. SYP-B2431]